jgi:hypothetical protein
MLIATVIQIDAAVVNPHTVNPSLKMTGTKNAYAGHYSLRYARRIGVNSIKSHPRQPFPLVKHNEHQQARRKAYEGVSSKPPKAAVETSFYADNRSGH